ncbi:MAG: helix-turn-helix domain-containing protein [Gammaproteobacteria bacterium]|nr:helix-turn-helix domain-containing protein [Gammaproteobacteria bacterium]
MVLEALKERSSLANLAQKYELHPNMIAKWKQEFLSKADSVFEGKAKSKKTESEEQRDGLLKTIGQLKVENDFLKNALR